MDRVVESFVASHKFMGSVLVARGDRVLFDKGYGSADLEWNVPNTPATKFRLGSLTKQFTAASILLLEERGKLSTVDPVSKYMPDAPAAWSGITIFDLLTHTSGIPNFTSFPSYAKLEPFPMNPSQLVALFRDKPLDFPPGEKMSYSNSGYILLGYLIEKITGHTYQEFVQRNILTPLGLTNTGFDSNAAIISSRAQGYVSTPKGFEHSGYVDMSIPYSAGALYSTTGDLLRWELGLFGGKLLKPASLAKMTTPFKSNYAFGLFVDTADGKRRISHGGGIEGFNTYLAYYPGDQLTVAALANVNGEAPQEIGAKLAALARGENVVLSSERREIELPRSVLDAYPGTYQLAPSVQVFIRRDGDALTAQVSGQGRLPLFAESETRFFFKAVDAQIDFAKDPAGAVTSLTLHQNGHDLPAPRISSTVAERTEITLPPAMLAGYPGVYTLSPGVTIAVTLDGGQLYGQVTGQERFPIFAEATDKFFFRVVDAQVVFERGTNGAVTGLVLHQGGQALYAPRQ